MRITDFQPSDEPSLLGQALELAALGNHVFPLRVGGKEPRTRHGFKDATRDESQIREWWGRAPTANIGISCGASGLIVVDLDIKNGVDGPGNWAALVEGIDHEPPFEVITPSGGLHHYWRGSGVPSSIGEVAEGVDIKAEGGYVVGPGSVIGGKTYRASHGDTLPRTEKIAPASEALAALVVTRRAKQTSTERVTNQGATAPRGNLLSDLLASPPAQGARNQWLAEVAGHYAARHRAEFDLYERHLHIANGLLSEPLDGAEFNKTLWSIWNTEQAKPQEVTEDEHAKQVAQRVESLLVSHDAQIILKRRLAELDPADPFDAGSLADILARPDDESYRVEGLIPSEGSTIIMAKRKTGKTTFNLNLAKSLILGGHFLGSFATHPLAGRIAILNFEVSGRQLARWAEDIGVPADRLYLVNLRGRRNPLSHPTDRTVLADQLRAQEVEALMVDPFGRAFAGNQNDAGEVGAWLVDLDQFARSEVGATDLFLNVHAGWNGERSRGGKTAKISKRV